MEYNISLYNSLEKIVNRLDELNKELEDPNIPYYKASEINKQLKRIQNIKDHFLPFKKMINDAINNEEMIKNEKDPEIIEMAKLELNELKDKILQTEEELKILLLPVDEYNEKNIIVEMRPAAGGDEASIFCADLFETYKNYCSRMGWVIHILDISTNSLGYDYVYFNVKGENVYSKMKFESGVHRVQRIPATENKGRVHTSTITVVVMPELDDVEIKIRPEDLEIKVARSGGAGGQHVNKTESKVQLTHLPTGITVTCEQERSQIKNREQAMKILASKLWERAENEKKSSIDATRKEAVGTGERSEKIRTYNYPQNRVTDHRIGLSLNKLDYIMQGYLDEIIDALISDEQKRLLEQLKI